MKHSKMVEPPHVMVAKALDSIAYQLKDLGNAGAATPMGAIEAHGVEVGRLADAVAALAEAVEHGLQDIASSISSLSRRRRKVGGRQALGV